MEWIIPINLLTESPIHPELFSINIFDSIVDSVY